MPLTFAHPAIVLPLSKLTRRRLSLTGLVIGSMTPDFEYFMRVRPTSIYSHTWPGLFWFDVPLGIMLMIGYEFWIKAPLITHLPGGLNRRFFSYRHHKAHYSFTYLIAIFISVLLGAASHIAWDEFTHPGGYFVQQIPQLRQIVNVYGYKLYVYTCLQHGSTALGLLLIVIVIFTRPKHTSTKAKHIAGFWLQVILVAVVAFAIKLATGLHPRQYGSIIITIIDGGLLGLVVASLVNGSS